MRVEIELTGDTERREEYVVIETDDGDPEKVWLNFRGYDTRGRVAWVKLDEGDIRRVAKALLLMGETTEVA